MKRVSGHILFFLFCSSILTASNKDVHWRLSDSAFAAVLRECGATEEPERWCLGVSKLCLNKKLWTGKTFGEITSTSVESDLSLSRLHQRGKIILEQLRSLDSTRLDAIIRANVGREIPTHVQGADPVSKLPSAELSGANVIVNYLVHHLIALHYAARASKQSPQNGPWIERALIYEAMAQSYLIDAFSAGHLLLPVADPYSSLHPRNNKEAHKFYSSEGVFVLNSRGDVWRTFGEELYEWYVPTFKHIFDACCTSLREVFLVFHLSADSLNVPNSLEEWARSFAETKSLRRVADEWLAMREGESYYSLLKMPTLLLLPMPISATWSLCTEDENEFGMHQRRHYPQLRDTNEGPGLHDPSLVDLDEEFIYSKTALPEWLLPESWLSCDSSLLRRFKDTSTQSRITLAADLIRHEKSVASVRYLQERYFAPTYWGLLFHAGGGYFFESGTLSGASSVGVGYAPPVALLPDVQLLDRLSVDLAYTRFLDNTSRQLLSLTGGVSFGLYPSRVGTKKPFRYVEFVRVEGGYAWGLRSPLKSHGVLFSLGLESGIIPLGFTYAGLSLRPKYQLMLLEKSLHNLSLEIVLQ